MEHIISNIILYVLVLACLFLTFLNLMGNAGLLLTGLVFAVFDGFTRFNEDFLLYFFIVFAIGELWEFFVSLFGVKRKNVSWFMVFVIGLGTLFGAIIGTAVLPILGSIIGGAVGAFLVAYIIEYAKNKSKTDAYNLAFLAFKTQLLAILGKITAGVIMAVMLIMQSFK
ncbi:MAG TPA: DUF456 family protein [Candidatus Avacidaminococcus intestinavium]|uniref:DUF456 family protein n=1 Tax=Candidatus Avacidaminococcus intestinavium TaxID=2840684 RepID=A0A9D1SKG6_9FIRM|nr:DUF456 family protein [Candidatus Avacidaminococcus intestinavium]